MTKPISVSTIALTAALLTAPTSASTAAENWNFYMHQSAPNFATSRGAKLLTEEIDKATGGELKVRLHLAGTLQINASNITQAVGDNVVQTVLVNYFQPRLMRDALGMHPILVLIGLLVGAQVAGVWGALFCIPILAVLNVFFNYAVNLRTIDEASGGELAKVIDEVQTEQPDAPKEEVVALAADRLAEDAADGEGASSARGTDDAKGSAWGT